VAGWAAARWTTASKLEDEVAELTVWRDSRTEVGVVALRVGVAQSGCAGDEPGLCTVGDLELGEDA